MKMEIIQKKSKNLKCIGYKHVYLCTAPDVNTRCKQRKTNFVSFLTLFASLTDYSSCSSLWLKLLIPMVKTKLCMQEVSVANYVLSCFGMYGCLGTSGYI